MAPNGAGKRRSETISVRLDPKLRYLTEIAALKQRRTVSSFVEWAIEDSLNRVVLFEDLNGEPESVRDAATRLWDVDEADRFIKLAFNFPDLLSHHLQIVWKLVRTHGLFWRAEYDSANRRYHWKTNDLTQLKKDQLRHSWEMLNKVARGEIDKGAIPRLPIPPKAQIADELTNNDIAPMDDEDIPF